MTQKSTVEDLKPLVDQLEDNLRQLKVLLEALSSASPPGALAQPLAGEREKPSDESPPDRGPGEDSGATAGPGSEVTLMEPEEFIQQVEKLQFDAETIDRLTIVEKQNRRLILLGGMVLAIVLVSILIIILMLAHPEPWFAAP
jgi:hypothetical protein